MKRPGETRSKLVSRASRHSARYEGAFPGKEKKYLGKGKENKIGEGGQPGEDGGRNWRSAGGSLKKIRGRCQVKRKLRGKKSYSNRKTGPGTMGTTDKREETKGENKRELCFERASKKAEIRGRTAKSIKKKNVRKDQKKDVRNMWVGTPRLREPRFPVRRQQESGKSNKRRRYVLTQMQQRPGDLTIARGGKKEKSKK